MNIPDLLHFLTTHLPSDGYCIIGLTWVDLYPSEELNFVLGESSCVDGCAVMSFGHFEPQSYNKRLNDTRSNSSEGVQSFYFNTNNSTISCTMPDKENSQAIIRLYLEDFADVQKVDKQMIWRLLRVGIITCSLACMPLL